MRGRVEGGAAATAVEEVEEEEDGDKVEDEAEDAGGGEATTEPELDAICDCGAFRLVICCSMGVGLQDSQPCKGRGGFRDLNFLFGST